MPLKSFPMRRFWWPLGVVLVLVVGFLVVVRTIVTADYLQGVINRALVPASGQLYRVEVGDLEYSLTGKSLTVRDLFLHLDERALDSLEVLGRDPAVRVQAQLDEVAIGGVDLFRLLRHRELTASRLSVTGPEIRVTMVEHRGAERAPEESPGDEPESGDRNIVDLSPVGNLPYVAIGGVHIENVNASLVMVEPGAGERSEEDLETVLEGLSFDLENFVLDPSAPRDPRRVAFSDDTRLRFELLHLELPGDLDLDIGPLSTSSRDQVLQVERVVVTPGYTEEEFLDGRGPRGDRIEATAGPLTFTGLAYWRIIQDLDVRMTHGRIEGLRVRVLSDLQRPPELTADPWMPHEIFQELPVRLAVDSLRVEGGFVEYTERGLKGRGTGSVPISNITATVTNASNDPRRMTRESPMVVNGAARLFEFATVRTELQIPLLEPAPTMLLKARAGGFDPQLVNGILPALEGVRVTRGDVDTAWVIVDYGPDKARGSVVAVYRNLQLRVEDRDTGEQNLGQGILSVVANIAVRGSNDPKPGTAPRAGKVDYRIPENTPFFQVLWEAVSDGLVNLVANL